MQNINFIALPGEINANGFLNEVLPPLSIYLLGSVLVDHGFNVKVYDSSYFTSKLENVIQTFSDFIDQKIDDSDIICISTNTFSWAACKLFCKIVKRKTKAKIVVGGLHPSCFFDYIIRSTQIDVVIRGEGEIILPQVISALQKGKSLHSIPAISYKEGGSIFHNPGFGIMEFSLSYTSSLPLFNQMPTGIYQALPLETSRGCLYNCAFCSIPFRHKRRTFPYQEIERQLVHALKYKDRTINKSAYINVADDCFTYGANRVEQLVKLFVSYNSHYFIEARVNDLLSNNTMRLIDTPFLYGFQIGAECGYDAGLKSVGKGITLKQMNECAKELANYNLNKKAYFSFIIGFPWETEKEINLTLDTIEKFCKEYGIQVSLNWLILLPSRLWETRSEYNIFLDESIFDKFQWCFLKDIFYLTHPQIDEKIFQNIERRIMKLQLEGCAISHAMPVFLNNPYLSELNNLHNSF